MSLHCFTDGTDTVIAESPDDAIKVWCEHIGGTPEDLEGSQFEQVDDSAVLIVNFEDAPEGEQRQSMTAAQWALDNGRGFLCSTEY